MRMFKQLGSTDAHQNKYGESVLALGVHATLPLVFSGGADSIVKVFNYI